MGMKYQPRYCKMYNLVCAPIDDSDQHAHPRSLITVFGGPSMDSQVSNNFQAGNQGSEQIVRMRILI